jgi:hypothetical protein
MSKSLESTAMCSRLASVGSVLDKSAIFVYKANIESWLKDNPSIMPRLWQMMETELIWELMGDGEGKHLPKSCVRMGQISATVKKCLIQRGMAAPLGRLYIGHMKQRDPKVIDKLFTMKYQYSIKYALKAALKFSDLFKIMDTRDKILGSRLQHVIFEQSGTINWERSGVYVYVCVPEEGEPEILEPGAVSRGTHVMHRASKAMVSLATLGLTSITNDYTFLENHDETMAHLSNGLRTKTLLWPDFEKLASFKYDLRFAGEWGSVSWKGLCGEEIAHHRAEAKVAITEHSEVQKKLVQEAAAMGVAPSRKRRTL